MEFVPISIKPERFISTVVTLPFELANVSSIIMVVSPFRVLTMLS